MLFLATLILAERWFLRRRRFRKSGPRDQDAPGALDSDRAGQIVDRDLDKTGIDSALNIQARQL